MEVRNAISAFGKSTKYYIVIDNSQSIKGTKSWLNAHTWKSFCSKTLKTGAEDDLFAISTILILDMLRSFVFYKQFLSDVIYSYLTLDTIVLFYQLILTFLWIQGQFIWRFSQMKLRVMDVWVFSCFNPQSSLYRSTGWRCRALYLGRMHSMKIYLHWK